VLQQRQVELPKKAKVALSDLAGAMEAGDAAIEELPPPPPEKNLSP
jgi:hypothetical protein